jgi:hypothetical protein
MANIPTIGDVQELSDKKPDVIQMQSVDKSQLVSDRALAGRLYGHVFASRAD